MEPAECRGAFGASHGALEDGDEAIPVFHGARAAFGVQPERGDGVLALVCLQERGAGKISQDIGIEHPEGFVAKEPARLGEDAASAEDFGLEGNLATHPRNGVVAEIVQDLPGVMVGVDEDVAHPPATKEIQGVLEGGLAPEREERLGLEQGEWQESRTIPGGQDNRFAGMFHRG